MIEICTLIFYFYICNLVVKLVKLGENETSNCYRFLDCFGHCCIFFFNILFLIEKNHRFNLKKLTQTT